MRVIIVGSGVIGVTTAYFLVQKGYEVTVLDRRGAPGLGASYANGGQLSYSHVDPLASPDLLPSLPRLALGLDSAFRMRPSLSPAFIRWVYWFLFNCRRSREVENTQSAFLLADYSRQQLEQLREQVQLDFAFRENGKLLIYRNTKSLSAARGRVEQKTRLGIDQRVLTIGECKQMEPALKTVPGLAGGVYAQHDESGDALLFTQLLAQHCEQLGVEFLYDQAVERLVMQNERVSSVVTNKGDFAADAVVLAAGVQTTSLCRQLSMLLPIYPLKGYSVTVPALAAAPNVSLTDMSNKTVYCRLGDRLRIAGIAELGSTSLHIPKKRVKQLLNNARKTLPGAGDYNQVIEVWAGLRPQTPDSLPLIGKTPIHNLYLNAGHGMLGWTMACGSSALLANIVSGESTGIEPESFSLSRFH